ncbi:dihydropteroate synthase [Longimicrobium terrae]|uniref:Dihydropteroate synthase n=1 Tax=Longimicrobium terrae TaxID=1639882 RepID=A0A841H1X7_9BACT|nr:dihydropteroate synthase [Longimicrobium terrae]MBB4637577.1 dihydropteroate synthase [Longimicrobium terrae]MBB6071974.1 dihydropteroate synthase [Longimicrobium terrae]NNC30519.1 dihydropteroate synthase [Longimicrobium terrae]
MHSHPPAAPGPSHTLPAGVGDDASWVLRSRSVSLERPVVMGILNLTPDSFSDGGRFLHPGAAVQQARRMVAEGADLIDVGGESTRPGADPVSAEEEAERVGPVLRALAAELDVPLSVDTRRASVARAALDAGAEIVNDVSGLSDSGMAGVVAAAGAGLVLMHMRGTPRTMQSLTDYGDVVDDVAAELSASLERADAAGIGRERIVVDPGIGFAKTGAQNLELIAGIGRLRARLGRPVLLGASRKAFIGALLGGVPADARDAGTVGACVAGLARGARLFRVHDVRGARQALDVAEAVFRAGRMAP